MFLLSHTSNSNHFRIHTSRCSFTCQTCTFIWVMGHMQFHLQWSLTFLPRVDQFLGFAFLASGQYLIVWAKSPPPLSHKGQLYSRSTGQVTLPSSDLSVWLRYTSAGSPFDWQNRQNPNCDVATGITRGLSSSWEIDCKYNWEYVFFSKINHSFNYIHVDGVDFGEKKRSLFSLPSIFLQCIPWEWFPCCNKSR